MLIWPETLHFSKIPYSKKAPGLTDQQTNAWKHPLIEMREHVSKERHAHTHTHTQIPQPIFRQTE